MMLEFLFSWGDCNHFLQNLKDQVIVHIISKQWFDLFLDVWKLTISKITHGKMTLISQERKDK